MSYHHDADRARAARIAKSARLQAQPLVDDDTWNLLTRQGEHTVQRAIDRTLETRACLIVLISRFTRGRRWINYEIVRAWNQKKGVLGIHVHNIADDEGGTGMKGPSPFQDFDLVNGCGKLSSLAPVHEAPFRDPGIALSYVANNLDDWIDEAIKIRRSYRG